MCRHNQVGIIAFNAIGVPIAGPVSPGGRGDRAMRVGAGAHDLAVDLRMDPETANLLRQISGMKEQAVEMEDFDTVRPSTVETCAVRLCTTSPAP